MNGICRTVLAVFLVLSGVAVASAAQFGDARYAIKADDGSEMTNFDLSPELMKRMQGLESLITVGNPSGDVTLYQFYDLNCPFCRDAAHDVDALLKADPKLKLVFVPYPVLSVASVQGGMVEVIAARMLGPEKFMELHRRIYSGRGVIDGMRVLDEAIKLGVDRDKLLAQAQTEATLNILKSHADFGSAAKLVATPAYVINGVAIVGHPGRRALGSVVASVRRCGKVVC
jgi:protein-disulfide isomerase